MVCRIESLYLQRGILRVRLRLGDVVAKSFGAVSSLKLNRSFPQLRDEASGHTRHPSKPPDARLAPVKGSQRANKQRCRVCKEAGDRR